jgi:hypothetical protein
MGIMPVLLAPQALAAEAQLPDHVYNRLWDVLERILEDPESAQQSGWANWVSTQRLFGTKIPGCNWTVYWYIDGDTLQVPYLLEDTGI